MIHPNSKITSFDLVIFGATGDLSVGKILPALFQRDFDGQIPNDTIIIGLSRADENDKSFKNLVFKKLNSILENSKQKAFIPKFLQKIKFISMDINSPTEISKERLKKILNSGKEKIKLFYFATGPELFVSIAQFITKQNLKKANCRIIIEKPLGYDLNSAKKINSALNSCFNEKQIYRIDHYLGKETVQNLMAIRFANQIFETHWSNKNISNIQVTVAETNGIAGRANYYDSYGAIKDMLQNHLLQLLCLVAMEPPSKFTADQVRDEKLKVLQSLNPITEEEDIILGQYEQGSIDRKVIPSYVSDSLNPKSKTETFVALKIFINNWRWTGVPFFLRTGKRLKYHASEIVITFKPIPHVIFDELAQVSIKPNQLVIRLQPDEGLKLLLISKEPGPGGMRLKPTYLNLSFADTFKQRIPDAYERLLMDVVRGNQTLFMRRDEVEAAWSWIDPLIDLVSKKRNKIELYKPGTWGPESTNDLIKKYNHNWIEPVF